MRDQDKKRFVELMVGTAELYGKAMSDALLQIYWNALAQYEIQDVEQALSRHALNPDGGQFMPKPADIVRYVDGGGSGKSAMAWTKVVKAIREIGGWKSVVFDEPAIQAVIADMGGWTQLCDVLQDPKAHNSNHPFIQRDFERRYKDYSERGRVDNYPNVLLGRSDAENQVQGFKLEKPRLIGDIKKAMAVLEMGADPKAIKHDSSIKQIGAVGTGIEGKKEEAA